MHRWWLRAGISAIAAAALLAFVPVGGVWAAMRGVSPFVWLASVGVFVAGHTVNAVKLRVLLGGDAATFRACLCAHFTGTAANLGLPGVAGGDVVRAAHLAPRAGASRVAVAAVADRVIDGVVLGLIVALAARAGGVPIALSGGSGSVWWRIGLVALSAAAVVAAWLVLRRETVTGSLKSAWVSTMRRPGAVLLAMALSAAVQSAFVLTNVWLAHEAGAMTALGPWFIAWTAAKLSAILPISLGGVGVREATLVSVLGTYGASPDAVLATGLLWEGAIVTGSLGGFLAAQLLRR